MRSRIAAWTAACLLLLFTSSAWAQAHVAGSEQFVKALSQRAIASLTQANITEAERIGRFRTLFEESFAVRGIAAYVMGRYWTQASPAQRDEFVRLFEEATVRSWSSRFVDYAGQQLVVTGAVPTASSVPGENAAIVRSEFRNGATASIKIDWRVSNKDAVYKITDILVEGLSLANTHRDEYASILSRNGGIDGMLKAMREKREDTNTAATPR